MNRKNVGISILCLVVCSLCYAFYSTNVSRTDFASSFPTEDSVLRHIDSENGKFQEFEKTGFTWKDSKGDEYPVYIAHTGSCFIIRTSKSGEDYRAYLGEEVSEQINKELSNRKSNDVVVQNTVYSSLKKTIVTKNVNSISVFNEITLSDDTPYFVDATMR